MTTVVEDKVPHNPAIPPWVAWILILALGVTIFALRPGADTPGVDPHAYRLCAIFFPCILGLMLQPMPGGALVFIALITTVATGVLPMEQALGGYVDSGVWMVLAAYIMARAFINTGLARRIALQFIQWLGKNTLGLSYALVSSDALMAGMIPSNAARMGGVTLPITRTLAELYQSFPGPTAQRLGQFLMLTLYQAGVVACALFYTGQASNPLAAAQAQQLTEHLPGGPIVLTYGTWLWYALVPALVSLLIIPWMIFKLSPPALKHTPEAVEFAARELKAAGAPSRSEIGLALVFACVCGLWITSGPKSIGAIALCGVAVLLLTRIVTWEDVIRERGAWDVFIWYGGLVQLGKLLNETGFLRHFANSVAGNFQAWTWFPLFLVMLLTYFYAHYAFASITTHIIAMYPAFVPILIAAGAPPALVVASFAFFSNFAAGLTHYGTTPGPIIFSTGYVSQGTWWSVGFWVSLVNIAIWLTIGLAWWKLVGLW